MTRPATRFFDDVSKLMTNAAGAAQGVRREIDTLVKTQIGRVLGELEVVQRDEFEAVREMAAKAREENEALSEKIAVLEKKLAKKTPRRAAAKK